MAVEITRYQPILDVAIPVVEEFVSDGRAKVVTGTHPDAVGMVIDLITLINRFYPHFDTKASIKDGRPINFTYERKRKDGIEHKVLEVELNSDINFNTNQDESYAHTTILDVDKKMEFPSKISVYSGNFDKPHYHHALIKTFRYYINVKDPIDEIVLQFAYMSLSSFKSHASYQSFDPLEIRENNRGSIIKCYPVSIKENHKLERSVWDFFHLPVFWDAWSEWQSETLCMLGGGTIEEIANRYGEDLDRVQEHTKKGKAFCYELIEQDINGDGNFGTICNKYNCPPYLRGVFLSRTLKRSRILQIQVKQTARKQKE